LLTGCLIWNTLVVFLGYRTGRGWDGSTGGLVWAGAGLAGATLLLWALGAGLYRILKRKR
jgi:membrane protein DedA with SNARE-associated domain